MRQATAAVAHARELLEHAQDLQDAADAPNTRRAYGHDLDVWRAFAKAYGTKEAPADEKAVVAFVAWMDKSALSVATIRRRISALARHHRDGGLPSPRAYPKVKLTMKGLVQLRGSASHKKSPVDGPMLATVLDDDDFNAFERTLFVVGTATGMRRSELCSIKWRDLVEQEGGVVILVPKSKTDKEGKGLYKGLPARGGRTCPARMLRELKKASKPALDDEVFPVSAQTVTNLVKRVAEATGYDPSNYSAHSLRAGLITTATQRGVPLPETMRQSGHTSTDVAQGYVRIDDALTNRAPAAVLDALDEALRKRTNDGGTRRRA